MTDYNVSYNIPRVQVQLPGRQNRLTDQDLHITPGMTEPFDFIVGNADGVFLNLSGYTVRFVVWTNDDYDRQVLRQGESRIVCAKTIRIDDPYRGCFTLVLDRADTQRIRAEGRRGLRWSVFLIDADQNIYPLQVRRRTGRIGRIICDNADGIPPVDILLRL